MKQVVLWFCLFAVSCNKNGESNNVPNPGVSISDVSLAEGGPGTTSFVFSVNLDRPTPKTVTVNYSTQDGSATAGSDYTAQVNQALTFAPNETSKTITITVTGDDAREVDETFSVVLSNATNATLVKSTGTGTIVNDDAVGSFPTLVWNEEFNGSSLNLADWSYENGDGCPNICGWGNNELEYYTSRPDNIYLQDGNLVIQAKKEDYNGRSYTSSKILTRDKKKFKYGRIEIRAKLPKGKGIWPALWMMPQSNVYGGWPKSGEIDIMELLGHQPNKVYATVHYGPGPGSLQIGKNYTLPSGDFSDSFHLFGLTWDANIMQFYVDGQLYSTVQKADVGTNIYPFNEEFYFIVNLAVGGNWPGSPDATTVFPQTMMVDYIRVYQ